MKTGRLTREEQKYIIENEGLKNPSEIAEALDRRVESILDYIEKLPSKKIQGTIDAIKTKPFWKELQEQFSEEEIEQFADEYSGFIKQFEGEILHSEEIQIIDAIRIGILANRCLKDEKKIINVISKLELDLGKEKVKARPDEERLQNLEHELSLNKQIQHRSSDRYQDLIEAKLKSLEKLKATREKRDDARNSAFKTNFKDWIKRLVDDKELREELGKHMEKMRLAMDKEYERLTKPHKYMDNHIDIPILNAETAHLLEEEDESNGN